ncbi:MAG: exo-beta-N-acetylmuramidase NamZ family protein [Streptosporangiaceae bacterium]
MRRRHVLAGFAGAAAAPFLGDIAAATGGNPPGRAVGRRVSTGVEELIASGYAAVRGQKVGVITNPTGVLPDLRHEVDVMAGDDRIDLAAVFGPEHGFRGTSQAGGSEGSYKDPRTGLPVYDTYGKGPDELADIFAGSGVDTLMFDIQDVGARFYTYIWTMYDSMRGAAMAGKRFVVLDRPNPITGLDAYGPVLHREYATFVGREPISQQHGMTVGELARLFNGEFVPKRVGKKVDLEVIRMRHWRRNLAYADTGLPWVMPSPNMPTVDTAWVYPGTCMFEGTTASEGRGTTRPFEITGAPYLDWHWADGLASAGLPGAGFRETYFTPTFSKWKGETCAGLQLYVADRGSFNAIHTAITMLVAAKRSYPDFAWRSDNWIDKLTGSDYVRKAIDAGKSADQVVGGWQDELAAFRRTRARYVIYRKVHGHGTV